jgi:hypothetical protein
MISGCPCYPGFSHTRRGFQQARPIRIFPYAGEEAAPVMFGKMFGHAILSKNNGIRCAAKKIGSHGNAALRWTRHRTRIWKFFLAPV